MKNETFSTRINDKFYFSNFSRIFYILRDIAGRGGGGGGERERAEGGCVNSSEPHSEHYSLVVTSLVISLPVTLPCTSSFPCNPLASLINARVRTQCLDFSFPFFCYVCSLTLQAPDPSNERQSLQLCGCYYHDQYVTVTRSSF